MTNQQMQAQFRGAVEILAKVVRKNPGTGGGQALMRLLVSLAFRVNVPMDAGGWSYQFSHPNDADKLDAILKTVRFRAWCDWPVDILPDNEIHGWIEKWKIAFDY